MPWKTQAWRVTLRDEKPQFSARHFWRSMTVGFVEPRFIAHYTIYSPIAQPVVITSSN